MIEFKPFYSSSKGNLYLVSDGHTEILIEAGVPYKKIQVALNFELCRVSGVLLSHSQGDHSKSIKDLLKMGLDCYMSKGTAEAINVFGHNVKIIKSKQQFKIGTLTILPFDTQHDDPEPLGFLIVNGQGEKLLFVTDSYYLKYRFIGLNVIAIECNHASDIVNANVESGTLPLAMKLRIMQSHFNLDNVKDFLRANDLSKVQEIHLIHLSEGNSDAERFKREIQELTGKLVLVAGE